MGKLEGRTVAFLATDGVELVELQRPLEAVRQAGGTAKVVALGTEPIQGFNHHDKGDKVDVDLAVADADPGSFDALVLPGGVINPDALRVDPDAVEFARGFFDQDKPVAAICHGPWTLIEAGVVDGRKMTSWPSLKTDLRNAGAEWSDQPLVVDGRLITSRKPDDLDVFCSALVERFADAPVRA
ncbi:MAG TPA: type 1 glutamine amidotransferase domain-containing protein [Thermoleophilia bacterium]|nr:type 1 glutamine amidotransferase domain-containing protein [Thermoleophilia bacterium]